MAGLPEFFQRLRRFLAPTQPATAGGGLGRDASGCGALGSRGRHGRCGSDRAGARRRDCTLFFGLSQGHISIRHVPGHPVADQHAGVGYRISGEAFHHDGCPRVVRRCRRGPCGGQGWCLSEWKIVAMFDAELELAIDNVSLCGLPEARCERRECPTRRRGT